MNDTHAKVWPSRCRAKTLRGDRCRKEAALHSGLCEQHDMLHAQGRHIVFWEKPVDFTESPR